MSRQISSSSSNCLVHVSRRSRTVVVRNIWSLPRLVTSGIFQHLTFEDKLSLRKSSSNIRCHIDDHIRRELIKWIKSSKTSVEFTHMKILVLSIEQFTKTEFNPPYIFTLIEKTEMVTRSFNSIWRELEAPARLEDKEKLLKAFYEEADKFYGEKEKKIVFTLTLLQIMKALSGSKYTCVHPFNRKSSLRIDCVFECIFFAIPFYNYIFDWFSFDRDWIQILLLLIKFMEIKVNNDATFVKFMRPVNFENATVIYGTRNPFTKRSKTPSKVKCCFTFTAEPSMTAEIKKFIETEEFDWENVSEEFNVNCKFSTVRAKVCKSIEVIKAAQVYIKCSRD